jgi:hypothetical protein
MSHVSYLTRIVASFALANHPSRLSGVDPREGTDVVLWTKESGGRGRLSLARDDHKLEGRIPGGDEKLEWTTASPESQGMNRIELEAAWAVLKDRQTTALLVIRHDRIVFERFAPGHGRTKPHGTASLAKALVGGLGLMVAMGDGQIRPDEPASRYVPQWRNDSKRREITIRHLATHTSGIEDAEEGGLPHDRLTDDVGRRRLPVHVVRRRPRLRPPSSDKLSLGFAKVVGPPEDFTGINPASSPHCTGLAMTSMTSIIAEESGRLRLPLPFDGVRA